jgi:hypothetical protein
MTTEWSERMDALTMRTTRGRGKLFASVLETVGDTPVVRVNNLAPAGIHIYVKVEAFNPAGSVRTGWRSASSRRPSATEA